MVFDNSTGGEMMRPMAVVAIGGLVYSTALTLFFIPALYMLGEKVKGKR
jgi:HAE1 family hydrophobic/amphiphilic exporter-1